MKRVLFALPIAMILLILAACGAKAPAGPAPTPDAKLASAGEKVVDDLAAGKTDAVYSQFTDQMVKALTKEQTGQIWGQLEAQFGKYEGRSTTTVTPNQGYQVVSVTANFEKGSLILNVVLDKDGKIAGLNMKPAQTPTPAAYQVPSYVDQGKFSEQEVTIGSGKWALPGTLTMPKGDGSFPAVVLVHGSGPNDRDETIGPNRPFKDIAWGLASQGIAVLRYDKRTKAHADLFTPEELEKITLGTETIDDAILAANLLAKTPGIDPKQIYVLGHSQGGMAAPRIGEQDPNLAGLIVLAGPGRPIRGYHRRAVDLCGWRGWHGHRRGEEYGANGQNRSAEGQGPGVESGNTGFRVSTRHPGCLVAGCTRVSASPDRENPRHAGPRPAGRQGLPGDQGRFRPLAGCIEGQSQCQTGLLSRPEPPLHDRKGNGDARGIHPTRHRGADGDRPDRELDQSE